MLTHIAHASFPSHAACSHTLHMPASRRTPHALSHIVHASFRRARAHVFLAPPSTHCLSPPTSPCPPMPASRRSIRGKRKLSFCKLISSTWAGGTQCGGRGPRGHRSSRIRSCARMAHPLLDAIPALKAYQSGGRRARGAGSRIASPAHQEQRRRRASPDVRAWRWGSTSTRSGGNHTSSETQARRDRGGLLYAGNRAHRKSWLLWSPMQSSPSISLQARTIQGHSRAVRGRALGTLSDDR